MQVLRFFCLWDDRQALFGDRRPYRLHYFLEDGSCEILETQEANSGRESFPVFLRRGLLPKVPNPTFYFIIRVEPLRLQVFPSMILDVLSCLLHKTANIPTSEGD